MTLQDEMWVLLSEIDDLMHRIENISKERFYIAKPSHADIGKLQLVREMLGKAVVYSDI